MNRRLISFALALVLLGGAAVTGTAQRSWGENYSVISVGSMFFKGGWNAGTSYKTRDAVFYNGSAWLCVAANKGNSPDVSPGQWTLVAPKGATGPQGPQGPIGAAGAAGTHG